MILHLNILLSCFVGTSSAINNTGLNELNELFNFIKNLDTDHKHTYKQTNNGEVRKLLLWEPKKYDIQFTNKK